MVKSNSEYKSIQKKLVAAVAMVLVASIMVVSSSYAWFTLSTAPEVTGIQTSVGSNGNLEIALRQGALSAIGYNDTLVEFPDANNYWGNLVDLSDEEYHFELLSLAPARLNAVLQSSQDSVTETVTYVPASEIAAGSNPQPTTVTEGDTTTVTSYTANDGKDENHTVEAYPYKKTVTVTTRVQSTYQLNGSSFLKVPTYGHDGRLSGLEASKVINGTYNEEKKGFTTDNVITHGVRAIGVSSSMTPAQMALLAAKQAVSSAISDSKAAATRSLRDDSVKLADIFVKYYLAAQTNKTAEFTATDVANVQSAISNLDSIADQLRAAVIETVVAIGVPQNLTIVEDTIKFDQDNKVITAEDAAGTDLVWTGNEAMQAVLLAADAKITAMEDELLTANSNLKAIDATDGITWTEISAPLTVLLKADDFTIISSIDGTETTVEKLMENFNKDAVGVAQVLLTTPTISINEGIYCDVASLSGNYSAATKMTVSGTFGSITMDNREVPVVMATNAKESEQTVSYTVSVTDENDQVTTENKTVTGFYLPLVLNQLSAVKAPDGGQATQVITDYYGYAVDFAFKTNASGSSLLLQTDAANRVEDSELTQGGGSYMQFKSGNDDFTLEQVAELMSNIRVVFINGDTTGNTIYGVAALDMAAKTEVEIDGVEYVRAPLYLHNFSVSADGKMTLAGKSAATTITSLPQNEAIAVSAVVFLDGDNVTNEDVAINGSSMSGTMNLQFASDAELNPMNYTFNAEGDLAAPTVAINDGVVSISGDANTQKFEIYVNDIKVGELSKAGTYTIPTTGLAAGTVLDIEVVAVASGYASASTEATYTVPAAATEASGGGTQTG